MATTKTPQKRGPKPKPWNHIQVRVSIWVPRKYHKAAQAACDLIQAKYR